MRMLEGGKLNGIYEVDWRDVNAHNVAIVCELYSLNTLIFCSFGIEWNDHFIAVYMKLEHDM